MPVALTRHGYSSPVRMCSARLTYIIYNLSATEDFQRQRQVPQINTQDGVGPGSCKRLVVGATETRQHVIDSWFGFLGTAKPNFIDAALLGNVRITIILAGANIINGDNAGIARSYSIRDSQHFSINPSMLCPSMMVSTTPWLTT